MSPGVYKSVPTNHSQILWIIIRPPDRLIGSRLVDMHTGPYNYKYNGTTDNGRVCPAQGLGCCMGSSVHSTCQPVARWRLTAYDASECLFCSFLHFVWNRCIQYSSNSLYASTHINKQRCRGSKRRMEEKSRGLPEHRNPKQLPSVAVLPEKKRKNRGRGPLVDPRSTGEQSASTYGIVHDTSKGCSH